MYLYLPNRCILIFHTDISLTHFDTQWIFDTLTLTCMFTIDLRYNLICWGPNETIIINQCRSLKMKMGKMEEKIECHHPRCSVKDPLLFNVLFHPLPNMATTINNSLLHDYRKSQGFVKLRGMSIFVLSSCFVAKKWGMNWCDLSFFSCYPLWLSSDGSPAQMSSESMQTTYLKLDQWHA